MSKKYRTLSSIILILAVIFLPSYIYIPALALAIILLPFFWEGILIACLIDILYGPNIHTFSSIFSTFAFMATVAIAVIIPIRRRIRTHV